MNGARQKKNCTCGKLPIWNRKWTLQQKEVGPIFITVSVVKWRTIETLEVISSEMVVVVKPQLLHSQNKYNLAAELKDSVNNYYFSKIVCVQILWMLKHYANCNYTKLKLLISLIIKLDGVGPADNRPSSYKLYHFDHFFYTWLMTRDMWHVTHDTWFVTHDTQGMVNTVSKFQVPSSNGLGVMMVWKYFHKVLLN